MQISDPERVKFPARSPVEANRVRRNSWAAPPRPRSNWGFSSSEGGRRSGLRLPVPGEKLKRQAHKEILRRALTPAMRRPSLRRWNFRPTPSRLSNMSMV